MQQWLEQGWGRAMWCSLAAMVSSNQKQGGGAGGCTRVEELYSRCCREESKVKTLRVIDREL